jgi:hypothetical protein
MMRICAFAMTDIKAQKWPLAKGEIWMAVRVKPDGTGNGNS